MFLLDILVGAASLAILAPALILSIEVLAAVLGGRGKSAPTGARPRLAVLVPAHDEGAGIRDALRSIAEQLASGDRLLVVADNCTDDTAAIAASEGAEVIRRDDPSHRGKGYALDFGVRHLERDPPEAVVIVDADCRLTEGTLDRLARVCAGTGRPVQALYLMRTPPAGSVTVRVAEFAAALKNHVRALGLHRLGLPCQLTGTGMAFPWRCIREAALASGHIVEDLKLGLELARGGFPPLFCPEAQVTSYFPASDEGFKSQRTRWEHGYLAVLLQDAPQVLLRSLLTRNGALLALGLDLCVPPIALLTLLVVAVWSASAALFVLSSRAQFPLIAATAATALLALSVLASWVRYGRGILSLGTLALAIPYALRKIPLYGRFLVARQLDWVRSKRDHDGPV